MSRTVLMEPMEQMVYPWGFGDELTLETKQALQSMYKAIGNNIVLDGFKPTVSFTQTHITFIITKGTAIQDSSLLELKENINVVFDASSTDIDPAGKFVLYLFFSAESEKFEVGVTYLDGSTQDEWDDIGNLIILNIYNFTKDTYNRVTNITEFEKEWIIINGNTYYKNGLHRNNIFLTNLISTIEYSNKYIKSNYTATPNETVFADTSENNLIINLPNKPPLGSKVVIIDAAGTFWDKSPRVARNGGKINGQDTDLFLRFQHSVTTFYYSGDVYGWIYNITRMWSVEGGTF